MTISSITKRVDRLEEAAGVAVKPRNVVVLIAEPHEADGTAAIERYQAEHFDSPDNTDFIVVVTGFSVPPRMGMIWDGRRWCEA
jgi:hypothetical protein